MGIRKLFDRAKKTEATETWQPTEEDFLKLVDQFFAFFTQKQGIKSEVTTRYINHFQFKGETRSQNIYWQEMSAIGSKKELSVTFAWFIPESGSEQKSLFFVLSGDNPDSSDKQSYRQFISREIADLNSFQQLEAAIQAQLKHSKESAPALLSPWQSREKSDV